MGRFVEPMVRNFVKCVVLITIAVNSVQAKNMSGRVRVRALKKKARDSYSVTFKEKAAVYTTSSKFYKCLKEGAKSGKTILVRWDMKSLKVTGCKK